jgi:hypothetical protein
MSTNNPSSLEECFMNSSKPENQKEHNQISTNNIFNYLSILQKRDRWKHIFSKWKNSANSNKLFGQEILKNGIFVFKTVITVNIKIKCFSSRKLGYHFVLDQVDSNKDHVKNVFFDDVVTDSKIVDYPSEGCGVSLMTKKNWKNFNHLVSFEFILSSWATQIPFLFFRVILTFLVRHWKNWTINSWKNTPTASWQRTNLLTVRCFTSFKYHKYPFFGCFLFWSETSET